MNTYKFEVVETVRKIVEVEANSREEAEQFAAQEDMSKNCDDYNMEIYFIKETSPDSKYPIRINDWELIYPENLTYVRKHNGIYFVVCMFNIGDDGDGFDYWVAHEASGDTVDDALEMLDIMPFPISDEMTRTDLEYTLLKYLEEGE